MIAINLAPASGSLSTLGASYLGGGGNSKGGIFFLVNTFDCNELSK